MKYQYKSNEECVYEIRNTKKCAPLKIFTPLLYPIRIEGTNVSFSNNELFSLRGMKLKFIYFKYLQDLQEKDYIIQ